MAEPTLSDVFGANATQDATKIVIMKADLAAPGYTPGAADKAETILFAIFKKAAAYLTPTALDSNLDQSISIDSGIASLDSRGGQNFRQQSYSFNVQKPDNSADISPDDL